MLSIHELFVFPPRHLDKYSARWSLQRSRYNPLDGGSEQVQRSGATIKLTTLVIYGLVFAHEHECYPLREFS